MRIVELSFGGEYAYLRPGVSIDLRKELPKDTLVKGKTATIILKPKSFYLLLSDEYIKLEENEIGFFFPKSTISRLGLFLATGVINPGFKGKIVMEVYNATHNRVVIRKGDMLGKVVVLSEEKAKEFVYNGSYQGQVGIDISLPLRP